MGVSAAAAGLEAILPWREAYRREMNCQIIHDSIHARPGWTDEYVLAVEGELAGYGSVAVGGPWAGKPTAYEFYVAPPHRPRLFELFAALLEASRAVTIEVQSNDAQGAAVVHAFGRDIRVEKILFEDAITTTLPPPPGARFRAATPAEAPDVPPDQLRWHGVVEVDGQVAGRGGVLFHYNPPYGDIFMDVAEAFRRRGIGSYLVQELKRLCHESGRIPAARCDPANLASRRTLQKAGFAPCGHILHGAI